MQQQPPQQMHVQAHGYVFGASSEHRRGAAALVCGARGRRCHPTRQCTSGVATIRALCARLHVDVYNKSTVKLEPRVLGRGTLGQVQLGLCGAAQFAVKRISLWRPDMQLPPEMVGRLVLGEIESMMHMKDTGYAVQLRAVLLDDGAAEVWLLNESPTEVWLLLEYISGGSLRDSRNYAAATSSLQAVLRTMISVRGFFGPFHPYF